MTKKSTAIDRIAVIQPNIANKESTAESWAWRAYLNKAIRGQATPEEIKRFKN